MKTTDKNIQQACLRVYHVIMESGRCRFSELQTSCQLTGHDLCIALIHLLCQNRIKRELRGNGVFYSL